MCGSGGVVYDATPPTSPCDRLTFRTVLNSPVPGVVTAISDRLSRNPVRLDIRVEQRGNMQVAIAVLGDRPAGAITSDALLRLLECIQLGNEYVAEVRDVTGARVEVQVERK